MKVRFGREIIDSQELSTVERQLWLEEIYHTAKRERICCTCNSKAAMHLKYRKKTNRYSLSCNPNHRHLHEDWCEFSLGLSIQQLQGTHYITLEKVNENELNLNMKHLCIFIPDGPARKEQFGEINIQRAHETASRITLGSLGRELLSRAWESVMLKYQRALHNNEPVKYYPSKRVVHIELNKQFLQNEGIKVSLGKKKSLTDVLWIGQKKTESFY